jgi:hypothetical protein
LYSVPQENKKRSTREREENGDAGKSETQLVV